MEKNEAIKIACDVNTLFNDHKVKLLDRLDILEMCVFATKETIKERYFSD